MFYGTNRLYVYTPPPIDYWTGWVTVTKAMSGGHGQDLEDEPYADDELSANLGKAKELAAGCGWEGDGTWRIAGLPPEDVAGPLYVLAVKQSNNGTTFIITPRELPWLQPYLQLSEPV